jgi:hypothetical protein
MILLRDRGVDVGFMSNGRSNGDLFTPLLDLISCGFHGIVVRKGIRCPVNDGIEHFEPWMSENHSIASDVSDIEVKGL